MSTNPGSWPFTYVGTSCAIAGPASKNAAAATIRQIFMSSPEEQCEFTLQQFRKESHPRSPKCQKRGSRRSRVRVPVGGASGGRREINLFAKLFRLHDHFCRHTWMNPAVVVVAAGFVE